MVSAAAYSNNQVSSVIRPTDDDLSGIMRKEMANHRVLNVGEPTSLNTPDMTVSIGADADVRNLYSSHNHQQRVRTRTLDWLSGLGAESPITSAFYEWADNAVSAVDTGEADKWPTLQNLETTSETWDIGLNNPVIYVISMAGSHGRRAAFAARFKNLSLSVKDIHWLPAINGSDVPVNLRNPKGEDAKGAELAFKNDPGIFGCFASHLMAYRRHLRESATRDILIFEDDAEFHPEFKKRWQEFTSGLPEKVWVKDDDGATKQVPWARIHIGGDGFWAAPVVSTPTYYQASWVSRTWAYVIKSESLKGLLTRMESQDEPGNMGIDQQLSGSASRYFPVLAPKTPLVLSCTPSTYAGNNVVIDSEQKSGITPDDWTKACWGLCYIEKQPCADAYDLQADSWPHNASLLAN